MKPSKHHYAMQYAEYRLLRRNMILAGNLCTAACLTDYLKCLRALWRNA